MAAPRYRLQSPTHEPKARLQMPILLLRLTMATRVDTTAPRSLFKHTHAAQVGIIADADQPPLPGRGSSFAGRRRCQEAASYFAHGRWHGGDCWLSRRRAALMPITAMPGCAERRLMRRAQCRALLSFASAMQFDASTTAVKLCYVPICARRAHRLMWTQLAI